MVKTTTRATDLDAIDRLEEKVKLLVDAIGQMRAEQSRLKEDNARIAQELDTAHARLAQADATISELSPLKDEREVIRARVSEMLEQIEALNL